MNTINHDNECFPHLADFERKMRGGRKITLDIDLLRNLGEIPSSKLEAALIKVSSNLAGAETARLLLMEQVRVLQQQIYQQKEEIDRLRNKSEEQAEDLVAVGKKLQRANTDNGLLQKMLNLIRIEVLEFNENGKRQYLLKKILRIKEILNSSTR